MCVRAFAYMHMYVHVHAVLVTAFQARLCAANTGTHFRLISRRRT